MCNCQDHWSVILNCETKKFVMQVEDANGPLGKMTA